MCVGGRSGRVQSASGHGGEFVVGVTDQVHFVGFEMFAPDCFDEAHSHIEGGDGGDIQGAAFQAVGKEVGLLIHARKTAGAPFDDRCQLHVAPDDQHAESHDAVQPFVRRHAEEIRLELPQVDGGCAGALGAVHAEENAVAVRQFADLFNRELDAEYVGSVRAEYQLCVHSHAPSEFCDGGFRVPLADACGAELHAAF